MSHNLTETATFDANVPVPDPGDARTAASVIQFAQPLADRTKYLKQEVSAANSPVGYTLPLSAFQQDQTNAADCWRFSFGTGTALYGIFQHDLTNNRIIAELDAPLFPFVTITNVTLYCIGNFNGGAAHGAFPGGKPAVMPNLTFREINPTSGASAYNVNQLDTSGTAGVYDGVHTISLTVNRQVDPINRYIIIIDGEGGANSLADHFGILGVKLSWTAP